VIVLSVFITTPDHPRVCGEQSSVINVKIS